MQAIRHMQDSCDLPEVVGIPANLGDSLKSRAYEHAAVPRRSPDGRI